MRSRTAGGFATDGENGRTIMSEKGDETTIYCLSNLKLLKTTKREYLAKCSHSKFSVILRDAWSPLWNAFPPFLYLAHFYSSFLSHQPFQNSMNHITLRYVYWLLPLLYCVCLDQASMQCIFECLRK